MDQNIARDEILARFKEAWDTLPDDPPARYDDKSAPPPDTTKYWARAVVRHGDDEVRAIGFRKTRHVARTGQLFVQLFTPHGDGLTIADDLSKLLRNAFNGYKSPSGVKFNVVSVREIGGNGTWYQTNVTAVFEYDEFQRRVAS